MISSTVCALATEEVITTTGSARRRNLHTLVSFAANAGRISAFMRSPKKVGKLLSIQRKGLRHHTLCYTDENRPHLVSRLSSRCQANSRETEHANEET